MALKSTKPGFVPAVSMGPGFADADVSNRGKRIGVLIVAYNAVTTLKAVLGRIPAGVWDNIEEIAVFDDASDDATYELALGHRLITADSKLHVVRNVRNLGYGGNQKAGYQYFINKGFDVVVLLHGDGQYAPEILHHMYGPIVHGEADAVFGSRMMTTYGGPLRGGMPLYKFVGNRILSTLENRALKMDLTEFHSGYRAYDLHALSRIAFDKMTDDFHFDTEIIIKLNHQGFRIAEVPIPTYYGSEICYVNGMKYAADVMRAVRRYKSTMRSQRRYPEFEEYYLNYPLKTDRHSSHSIVQRLVGAHQRVLDIGAGEGYFAQALKRDGNVVTGVDIIPAPREREAFASYVCADLNRDAASTLAELGTTTYDRVLLMDILQHTVEPSKLVDATARALDANGRLIASLPNIANFSVRLKLAFGNFDYAERGILDRKHLHFYTRKTARKLLLASGLKIVSEHPTVVPLELFVDWKLDSLALKIGKGVLRVLTSVFPEAFAYQWVFELARAK